MSKSFGLLLDDCYHINNPLYTSVTFRRTYPQIRNPGGLWDTAEMIYPAAGGKPNDSRLEWHFPSGSVVKFSHLQYEGDKQQWQGAQLNAVKFDELDHFSESTFFYMLSRNRSVSGITPYMRATVNANADSWVAKLIAWWIDWDTGLPIPERAGVIRWFIRDKDEIIWADHADQLPWIEVEIDGVMVPQPPRSLTFIPAKVTDNKELLSKDPGYLAGLLSMPALDRARLLEGNWRVRAEAGSYFRREWFPVIESAPVGRCVRYWDLASTTPTTQNPDPDWTVGALVSESAGRYTIHDIRRLRGTPQAVESLIAQTAALDGRATSVRMEEEGGASGKQTIDHYRRLVLAGYDFDGVRSTGKKELRAKPVSSAAEAGNILLLNGSWVSDFLEEAVQFPEGPHDDQIDGVSGAIAALFVPRLFHPEDIAAAATQAEEATWLFQE